MQRLLQRGGSFATPFWKATQIDPPDVDAKAINPTIKAPQSNLPSVPISQPSKYDVPQAPAAAPAQPVPALGGLGLFPAADAKPLDWLRSAQQNYKPVANPWPSGAPDPQVASPGATPPQPAAVPLPQARPAEAPQSPPDTSFFMRNALMMQDPNGGGFIDPMGAKSVTRA
jgi:hypothetical protein